MIPATITWDNVPGSFSTLFEYKLAASSTWITPSSPANPTPSNSYTIMVTEGTYYDIRLTTNGGNCAPKSSTRRIITPNETTACCPVDYTISTDGTYCYQTTTTAATSPTAQEITVAKQNVGYGIYGTAIYNPGYALNGTGAFTIIPFTNPFWVNGNGYGAGNNTTQGPNNRTGLWATNTTSNQDVGFTVCVVTTTPGTYYVGTMGDNSVKIVVDGTTVVNMNAGQMATYYATNGYPGMDAQVTFRFWHIYPVYLNAGDHTIEIIGHNDSGVAAMGAEVYNATSGQLQAAASYGDLGGALLFSSKDFIGQNVQYGTGGAGFTCPSGFSLVLCDGPAYCSKTITTSTIPC